MSSSPVSKPGHEGTLEESSLEELRRQFDVNVFGAVAMMKAVLPYMRERRHGHIVSITSMAGYVGLPGRAAACALAPSACCFASAEIAEPSVVSAAANCASALNFRFSAICQRSSHLGTRGQCRYA